MRERHNIVELEFLASRLRPGVHRNDTRFVKNIEMDATCFPFSNPTDTLTDASFGHEEIGSEGVCTHLN